MYLLEWLLYISNVQTIHPLNILYIHLLKTYMCVSIQLHYTSITYLFIHLADSWPEVMDDRRARSDWGWQHTYDLPKMTEVMVKKITKQVL